MSKRKTLLFKPLQPLSCAFMVIAILTTITGCTFDPSGETFDPPLAELTDSGRTLIFEDEGNIAVFHGFGCAESNKSGKEDFLRVQESMDLPDYATAATVFLNGWELKYLNSDHHIRGLGTGIAKIEIADRKLNWEAGGVLADRNFDDGYSWCYYYTIIAWNEAQIDALIDQNDGDELIDLVAVSNTKQNNTTALKMLPRFVHNTDFTSREPIAVLPRGYGFEWRGGIYYGRDHHLLQLAYNLDYSEIFIQYEKNYLGSDEPSLPTPASYVDSGFVSWDTKTIFKDNSLRRDYGVGEIVSVLGGSDIGILQPPFTLLPREDVGWFTGCIGEAGVGVKTKDYVVENIPFEYAVPMLTGWELTYPCDDEHVARIGIWITEFQYDKSTDEPTGTLRYTISSILQDKDGSPGHISNHRVSILGLKPVVGTGEPTAVILSPQQNDSFAPGTMVTLQGEGIDPEDGTLSGSDLMWFSDRDGFLGSGASLQIVLSGPVVPCDPEFVSHTITLRVTDSDGHQSTQQIVISVGRIC
ncbi:hypothetical protein [Candidatus Kuenenia sp.]|uniref:hypothetical protein n=1 Tax=Candidatus Kuenenia sp. TaxID=2499824 RepID=UPI00321F82B3